MSRSLRLIACIAGLVLAALLTTAAHAQGSDEHPFMLVRDDQYADLRERAAQEPWRTMQQDAIAECNTSAFPRATPGACLGSDTFCMRSIMGACSLAYILDPDHRATYLEKVRNAVPYWEAILVVQSGADDGTRNTRDVYFTDATAAMFNTILALDVMHDDLAALPPAPSPVTPSPWGTPPVYASSLQQAETLMEQEYNHFYGYTRPVFGRLQYHIPALHPPTREAALITWKIYRGELSPTDSDSNALMLGGMLNNGYPDYDRDGDNIEGYIPEITARINPSGVYSEGSTYAHAGWSLDRDERSHLVDVLEFTGLDAVFGVDFYTNPRFQNFYEWLYGYATTPAGVMTGFGDTYAFDRLSDDGHGGNIYAESSHIGQAGRFSDLAGGYALWKRGASTPQGRLLNYVLLELGAPATPQSRVFANGGAFFVESSPGSGALYGALWNVMEPEVGSPVFHVRDDVNAVYIAAYGESLLMNGGFCGSSSSIGPDGCSGNDGQGTSYSFSGDYLGQRAVSNNTALVAYTIGDMLKPNSANDHIRKFGGGIVEGFAGLGLDYALGTTRSTAGDALPNGSHARGFVFVHPEEGANGYFILFDEISLAGAGPAHLVFHPNTLTKEVVVDRTEYDHLVRQQRSGNGAAGLTLFFGTEPESIQFPRGIIATRGRAGVSSIVPEYYFNSYPVNPDGTRRMVTVLFPYDRDHAKGAMTRIAGPGYTGATITQGGTADVALESDGAALYTHGELSFNAKALFYRSRGVAAPAMYFARSATEFDDGAPVRSGFQSSAPLAISVDGGTGAIVSPGALVTFYLPDVAQVRLDGVAQPPVASGPGWARIHVPAGAHGLALLTDGAPPPTAAPSPTPTMTPTGLPPTATDTPTPTPTATRTATPSVTAPPPTAPAGNAVHVGDLDGSRTVTRTGEWSARVRVTIHLENHSLVTGASARAALSGAGIPAAEVACSFPTNASGFCNINSPLLPAGLPAVTVRIAGLDAGGYLYDPAANHNPDGDSDGTTIVITK